MGNTPRSEGRTRAKGTEAQVTGRPLTRTMPELRLGIGVRNLPGRGAGSAKMLPLASFLEVRESCRKPLAGGGSLRLGH